MKKLVLAVFAVMMFSGAVFADKLELNVGIGTLQVPFQDGSVVQLWDANHNVPLTGLETTIGKIWKIDLTGGGIISSTGQGMPYGGLNYTIVSAKALNVLQKIGLDTFDFGVFGGYDFSLKNDYFWDNTRYGLKISTKVLG